MHKRSILIPVLLILLSVDFSSAQNFNWITPDKVYLKLYVINEGMTRINRSDFVNAGINTSVIDPRTVKVYYKGSQIPVYFQGEQDGVFNDGDYIDFYGTRNYGGVTTTYGPNNDSSYSTNEYYNLYSDTSVYWADWGGINGLRFMTTDYSSAVAYTPDYYFSTMHFEKDKIYSQGENVFSSDYRYLNTEKFLGEGWYWSLLSNNMTVSDTFSLPGLSSSALSSSLRIFAYPQNSSSSVENEHAIEVRVNGNLISTLHANHFDKIDTTVNFSSSVLSGTSINNINIKYVAAPGFDGYMFFDLFELSYPKSFRIYNNKLSANLITSDTVSKLFKISGYNSVRTLNIYDVRNNIRITNFSNTGDTLRFTGKTNALLQIVNDSVRNKPLRIKQKQVPNLISNTNGADYLIIYNSLFQSQAEQLRAYRQTHDNFRSVKTEIENIYDIFNYGIEDPVAVKYFVKYVNDNWQLPKNKYVCLFGRGSLDPKKNSSSSVYEKNYVPVYGNPNSDGYFANFNTGTFFYYDMVSVGRIPAYFATEAQTMVDKIIAYENEAPDRWPKTFTYVTGGSTYSEQQSYQLRSNFESNQYVIVPPISGETAKIYRSDTSGNVTFNYADSIINTINRGTLFVNFRGHAGSHDWEVGMQDPNTLSNGNKLPIILSLTCFTGENSKSEFRGFGEKFMYLNGKGSIGFVGTTGWSFVAAGNDFGTYIIQSMKLDSTRRIGDLLKVAGKSMSSDSFSFSVRHTVNCYNLLGDPAVKLKLPKYPEFVINNNDYSLSSQSIALNEPITLKITPKNYGLYADTCRIRFQLKKNNINYLIKDTAYRAFRFMDTILYKFKIDTPGVYKMTVILDQNNRYPFEDESNNTISFNIPFNEYAFLPVGPVDNSIIFKDSVELSGLNPGLNYSQNSVKVLMQLDTNNFFNSPLLQTFVKNILSGTDTKFKSSLPVLINNTLYYWRTNSVINGDSTGWTKTRVFIYNNRYSAAEDNDNKDRLVGANKIINLMKYSPGQFPESDFNNTGYYSDGIRLNEFSSNLFVRSYGSNAEEASYFSVGNRNIYIDGGANTGLNLLKVRKLNGSILEFKNFRMNAANSSDSLINFLNTFDSTYYLMLLNAAYVPGGTNLSAGAKNKLREFGSVYCDSIGLTGYFHSWSFIGSIGASSSQVSEMFDPCCRTSPGCVSCDHWSQSVSSMEVVFKKTYGTVTNLIGPSKEWTEFYWNYSSVPANSNLAFDVIGINAAGIQTLLFSNLQTNKFVELSSIDAKQYPFLNLLAKFSIDTISGKESPVLNSVNINYTPAAELVLDRNTLQINSNSKDNNVYNFSFDYHNSGFGFNYGTIVNLYNGAVSDVNLILTDTISTLLKTDSTLSYSNSFTFPPARDSARIYVNIKPKDLSNEFYYFNNTADFKINFAVSKSDQSITLFSDGKEIKNGDYVSRNPEMKISIVNTENADPISDTTKLRISLNGNYVPYFLSGKLNPVLKTLVTDDQKSGKDLSVNYFPSLNNGVNKLTVSYRNGNDYNDTVSYDVNVSDRLLVNDLYNYPNPMKDETNFIFNLEGYVSENLFKIRIYTISGRLIKEIDYTANPGNNVIRWDGRDNDGDFVANGTYFYKLVSGEDSKSEIKVQKLVVLK
jgi:hypothetical protein